MKDSNKKEQTIATSVKNIERQMLGGDSDTDTPVGKLNNVMAGTTGANGVKITEDGLPAFMARNGANGRSYYDMLRDDYNQAVAEGRAKPGMLPTEDEINRYMASKTPTKRKMTINKQKLT